MKISLHTVTYQGLKKVISGQYDDGMRRSSFEIHSSRIPFHAKSILTSQEAKVQLLSKKKGVVLVKNEKFDFVRTSFFNNGIDVYDSDNQLIVKFPAYTISHVSGRLAKVVLQFHSGEKKDSIMMVMKLLSRRNGSDSAEIEISNTTSLFIGGYPVSHFMPLIVWNILHRYY